MTYTIWNIGGLTPSWVEPDFKDDRKNRMLTLKCAAIFEEVGADPLTETNQFDAMASEDITNEQLLNGGSNLQVSPGGSIFEVTRTSSDGNNTQTWPRCALEKVEVPEDSSYMEGEQGSVIEYELVIHYETSGVGGSLVFTPDYSKYDEIEYYLFSDKTNPVDHGFVQNSDSPAYGNELGWMKITVPKNVRKVEVYGCGDCGTNGTDCWIEVNGEKRYWKYTDIGDKQDYPGNILKVGFQKFTWNLTIPTPEIILCTSRHIHPTGTCENNKGCWLQWIRLIPE